MEPIQSTERRDRWFTTSRKRRTSSLSTQLPSPVHLTALPPLATTPSVRAGSSVILQHGGTPSDDTLFRRQVSPPSSQASKRRSRRDLSVFFSPYQRGLSDIQPPPTRTVRDNGDNTVLPRHALSAAFSLDDNVGALGFDDADLDHGLATSSRPLTPAPSRPLLTLTQPATTSRPNHIRQIAARGRKEEEEEDRTSYQSWREDTDSIVSQGSSVSDDLSIRGIPDIGRRIDEVESTVETTRRCAQWIFNLLSLEDFGCGVDIHQENLDVHLEQEAENNHHGLADTHTTNTRLGYVQSRAIKDKTIGLNATTLPTACGEQRSRFIEAKTIRRVIEGESPDHDSPVNICLHNEYSPTVSPSREFDVDSLLVFPESLGAFQVDVRLTFTKQLNFNIHTDLHITKRIKTFDEQGNESHQIKKLKHIPHLYIGTVEEFHHSTLFVFFPRLVTVGKEDSSWLTDEQARRFFDFALLPACRQYMSDGALHHLVPSTQVAQNKARAKGQEQQASDRERGLRQCVNYVCQASHLRDIWDDVLHRVGDPDSRLDEFQDLFLFFDTKNMKGKFKATSPYDSLIKFHNLLERVLVLDEVDLLADVATETTPPQQRHHYGGDRPSEDDGHDLDSHDGPSTEPTTYLWKTCCLETYLKELRAGPFDGKKGKVNRYQNGFLRDVSCMTVETPLLSRARKGGWVYGQWYNVVKEIEDAQQVHPFAHAQLPDLAIDESIFRPSSTGNPWATVRKSYLESKRRVNEDYQDYRYTSFGVRLELRLNKNCILELIQIARSQAAPPSRLPSNPESVWAITTETWVEFMLGNYEKFTSLIEMAIITSPATGIELRTSRLIQMLLFCLQHFANANLWRYSVLRRTRHEMLGGERYGLGFEESLVNRGFGWFAGICDWERLRFKPEFESLVIPVNRSLTAHFRQATRLIHGTKDGVDLCYEYLRRPDLPLQCEDALLTAVAHFILRQYRRDLLDKLEHARELREAYLTQDAKDQLPFCYDGFTDALLNTFGLAKSNKCRCKEVEHIFEWLMGDSTHWNREIMDGVKHNGETMQWRQMLRLASIAMTMTRGLCARWKRVLRREFDQYFWLVPYPNPETGSCISLVHKANQRLFWSMDFNKARHWTWSRGTPRSGRPPPYPRTLYMSTEQLKAYFDAMLDAAHGKVAPR